MVAALIAIYLAGWMLTTAAVLAAARVVIDDEHPPKPQEFVAVSVIAGAIWPLLLVGIAELGSLLTRDKLHS